jgi:hypothetical protein
MTTRHALLGLALVLLGSACQQHELPVCDITQRECQVDIYYRMLSLRGDGYDPFGGLPPVHVMSESDYRALLIQQQSSSQTGPNPWNNALALLHINSSPGSPDGGAGGDAGGSTIDDEVAHTLAFYDGNTKTITVIDHPDQTSANAKEDAMITLAHELVHALQDRELDLKKEDFQTSDEYFAYDTIIEGDARFYEYMFANEIPGYLNYSEKQMLSLPQRELDNIYTDFAGKSTAMFLAQLLVYPLGANYEAVEYGTGGNAAVRHGYSKEPHHMVGFLENQDGGFPAVAADQGCPGAYASSLPSTGRTVGQDEFGAVLFYAFLRGWNVDHETAYAAAQSWTGDVITVQSNTTLTTTAVSWRLDFKVAPPSSIASILSSTGELTATTGTHSLEIRATDSRTPLDWTSSGNCP